MDYAEEDLARLRRAREDKEGNRRQVRCRRCRCAIPEGKRADAVYCSTECKRSYRWEQRDELRQEIRHAIRAQKVRETCPCGTALDTTTRRGPVPVCCRRCYMREARRKWRVRKREGVTGAG